MALLQKKPQLSSSIPLYSFSAARTIIIVGLGNIGPEYEMTRHNMGFLCVDGFATEHTFPDWSQKKKLKAELTTQHMGETQVILAKPTTMMNRSGEAVQALLKYYSTTTKNLIVIYDDLDISFGAIRSRGEGTAGGHNGLKSIISTLGEDFGRIRVGIGPKPHDHIDSADFVLGKFTKEDREKLPIIIREATVLLTETIFGSGELPNETRNAII